MKIFFKILNLIALLVATSWMTKNIGPESVIAFVTLLATFSVLILEKDNTKEIVADEKLFEKFNDDLPQRSINYIERVPLTTPFRPSELEPFFRFDSLWNDIHHTFLNKGLEKKKKKLFNSISDFNSLIATNTFSTHNIEIYSIPEEWESDGKKQYNKICQNIENAQNKVIYDYNNFVKKAKKTLKI